MNTLKLIEKFNKQFPVGSIVRWRSVNHRRFKHKEYIVARPATIRYGQAVAWLQGKAESVSISPGFVDYEILDAEDIEKINEMIQRLKDRIDKDADGECRLQSDEAGWIITTLETMRDN